MAKNIIKLNRGDFHEFTVSIPEQYYASEEDVLVGSDLVCFAVLYPHQRFEEATIIFNGYGAGDLIPGTDKIKIEILPKNTLNVAPGIYYYTVKLFSGITFEEDGTPKLESAHKVRTLIERTKFIINE
jgi:hypothetical protein